MKSYIEEQLIEINKQIDDAWDLVRKCTESELLERIAIPITQLWVLCGKKQALLDIPKDKMKE